MPHFNCKNFFLTYPQCSVSKETLLTYLIDLQPPSVGNFNVIFIRVCKETHQDGHPHLHALFCLQNRYKASSSFFDYDSHHPNIQGARSINHVKEYLAKEGDFIDFGEPPSSVKKRSYGDLLSEASSKEELWSAVIKEFPRDAVLNMDRILSFAEFHYKAPPVIYKSVFDSFKIPEEVAAWHSGNLVGPFRAGERRLSLILISPTRYGKTQWARSLGPHLYFNNMFDLGLFSDLCSYAIFDDLPWEHFSKFHKQWMGCQETFTVTDKYRKKKTISWGKPSIFLCNPEDEPPESNWLNENSLRIRLRSSLF